MTSLAKERLVIDRKLRAPIIGGSAGCPTHMRRWQPRTGVQDFHGAHYALVPQ